MKSFEIIRMQSSEFWKGFDEESKVQFADFLHCGFSPLYSEKEKEQIKLLKTDYREERQIFLKVTVDGNIVARSFSEQSSKDTLFMCMSFVKKEFRNQGIYKKLLQETIKLAKEMGYLKIISFHNTSNNEIIIPKLKAGFVITGIKVNAGFGTLVELTYLFSPTETDMQNFRCGFRKPTEEVKKLLSI